MSREYGASFVAGQALRVVQRLLMRERLLMHVRWFHRESDVGIAQKFCAARRGRSQNQEHASTILKPQWDCCIAASSRGA
jgi:hypothetical protein